MPTLRRITEIIIHCSASPNGQWTTVEDIDAWHATRGFQRNPALIGANQPDLKSIGYHYVIYTNGAVVIGRGEAEIGAHCLAHNAQSIGICVVGTDQFSANQWRSLAALVRGLRERLPSIQAVLGHRDTSPDKNGDGVIEGYEWLKTCPGFDMADWLRRNMEPPPLHILPMQPKEPAT